MTSKTTTIFFLSLLILSALSNAVPIPTRPKYIPYKNPPVYPFCPHDVLKLGACADLLGGVGSLLAGEPLGRKCCTLLDGLANAEAAACLCTVVKESVLGITTEWSVAVSLLVSSCKKKIPDGFRCI